MTSGQQPTGERGMNLRTNFSRRQFMAWSAGATAAACFGGRARAEVDPQIYARVESRGFPKPRFVETNGIGMAAYSAGDSGMPVIFSRGFPELAYSWRHQLPALA